jgi:primosomal protein N' (replication factor Y) (superfamily II helicase)
VDRPYSYIVPEHFWHLVRLGRRVVVPFGKRKLAGVIVEEGKEEDLKGYAAKEVIDVDMELPVLPAEILKLTKWIGQYYMCSWGEAARVGFSRGETPHQVQVPELER